MLTLCISTGNISQGDRLTMICLHCLRWHQRSNKQTELQRYTYSGHVDPSYQSNRPIAKGILAVVTVTCLSVNQADCQRYAFTGNVITCSKLNKPIVKRTGQLSVIHLQLSRQADRSNMITSDMLALIW